MKVHWYCFSFHWVASYGVGFACSYSGWENKDQFTYANIEEQKRHANPECDGGNMVLVGITYLGYMTKEEFRP